MNTRRQPSDRRPGRRSVYTPEQVPDWRDPEKAGVPGKFPFTRGIHSGGYRSRVWAMRQYAGFGGAEDANRRFRLLLEQGSDGLSVAFDLPTQLGLDSDHPLAEGEVGRVGVAVSCLEDMELLFSGIPLERISVSMTINATAPIILAFYLALARNRGIDWGQLRGTVQNDILKEYLARGTYVHPPAPSLSLAADLMGFCSTSVPRWYPISVSGYHLREAGCTAAQELAFTLSHAETYLSAAASAGIPVSVAARQFSFFLSVDRDFLEEIAKFRAARRLWATRLKERFGVCDERALAFRFHAQTAGSSLTARQPDNNLARVTFQALAAVLGGAQSLHTNARDEAMALPSEESATVALRTQQILALETGLTDCVDPLGGSWCIEALTDELDAAARSLMDEIDRRGGVLGAMEQGFQRRLIEEAAYEAQLRQERGEWVVVGVNRYPDGANPLPHLDRPDPAVAARRRAALARWRDQRDLQRVREAIDRVRSAARLKQPVMPHLIDAAEAKATLGEISSGLREIYGEHLEPPL
jgi:methylmalonyl-CoA mutase, N-terminal domain